MTESTATVVALADRRAARELAAAHLYDAECALHAARAARVDTWICAAGDKLHAAVAEYLAVASA